MDKEPITVTGLKNLKSELEDLKNIRNGVTHIFIYLTEKR